MIKGLEAFYDLLSPIGMTKEGIEKFILIEKELKAFDIIKKRECVFKGLSETTQEELEFLLEVLK